MSYFPGNTNTVSIGGVPMQQSQQAINPNPAPYPYFMPQPNIPQIGFGSVYNKPGVKLRQFKSNLSPELEAVLKDNHNRWTLGLSPEEQAKSLCNHQDSSGVTLRALSDGQLYCTKCKQTFRSLKEIDPEGIHSACDYLTDVIQWVKLFNVTGIIPQESLNEYCTTIGLIGKLLGLWDIAKGSFETTLGNTQLSANGTLLTSPGILDTYNSISNGYINTALINGGYYNNGGQAPLYGNNGYAYQQPYNQTPMYGQQPPQASIMMPQQSYSQVQQPMYGQQQPFMAQQPAQASIIMPQQPIYQPQAPMYGQQQPQQVMPAPNTVQAQPATSTVAPTVAPTLQNPNPLDINSATQPVPTTAQTAAPQTQQPAVVTKTFNS